MAIPPLLLIVQAPSFPTYVELAHAMRAFAGERKKLIRESMNNIYEQADTPQSAVE
jgi:hypothetical protein